MACLIGWFINYVLLQEQFKKQYMKFRRISCYLRTLLFFVYVICYSVVANAGSSSTVDFAENFLNRKASLMRMGDAKYVDNSGPKSKSYDVLAVTALKGCGSAEWPAYMASLSTLPVSFPPDGPVEIFSMPPLVRYLYQYGDCMTPEQKQKLLTGFTSQRQWLLGHGTINHAILKASSWYLLAQYFPNARWTHWDGTVLTSQQLMAALKPLLHGRKSRFYKSGQYEWLSPTYAMVNVFPLLNLIDFAADPTVKKTAQEEAILEISVLKAHSFHGEIVPPLTRKNFDQRNTTDSPQDYVPAITQHLLWYYFGEPTGLGLYDFQGKKEPFYASIFGMSNWVPPADVLAIGATKLDGYAIKVITPSFGIWDAETSPEIFGDSYIADDFAIGTGNQLFEPGGYSGHIQTFSILLKSSKPQNQIECYQPYWKSNSGEDAWGTDRSSPFQQMYRYDKSSVVMLFDTPKKDPWVLGSDARSLPDRSVHKDALLQLAQCRIPKSLDEIIKEENWVFIRQGGVFVAMATLLGTNEYDQVPFKLSSKYLVVKVREPKTALFFRVERETAEMNFSQFRERVQRQTPKYDVSTSSVNLIEQSGTQTQLKFKLQAHSDGKRWSAIPEVLQNGKRLLPVNAGVIDSPVLKLKNGVLTFWDSSAP